MTELTGKRALVTGSKSGIGFAIAKRLVQAGAEIILHARSDSAEVEEAKMKLAKLTTQGVSIALGDFSDPNSCRSIFEKIKKDNKPIDILVNNAAIQPVCALADMSSSDISQMLEINLQIPIMMTRYFAEYSEKGGSILNIGSVTSHLPLSKVFAYSASKAAVVNLTKNVAREYATQGVRVNAICPGFFPAEQNRKILAPERVEKIIGQTPMDRFGEPEELIGACLLLCSRNAGSFITGADYYVDGGFTANRF